MIERFAGFVGPKCPVSEIKEDVYESYFYDLARSYPWGSSQNARSQLDTF